MAGKKQKQEGVGAWIAIVILFAVGLWPIALAIVLVIAVPYIPFSAISGFPPAAAEFLGSFHPPGLPAGPKRPCAAP